MNCNGKPGAAPAAYGQIAGVGHVLQNLLEALLIPKLEQIAEAEIAAKQC